MPELSVFMAYLGHFLKKSGKKFRGEAETPFSPLFDAFGAEKGSFYLPEGPNLSAFPLPFLEGSPRWSPDTRVPDTCSRRRGGGCLVRVSVRTGGEGSPALVRGKGLSTAFIGRKMSEFHEKILTNSFDAEVP